MRVFRRAAAARRREARKARRQAARERGDTANDGTSDGSDSMIDSESESSVDGDQQGKADGEADADADADADDDESDGDSEDEGDSLPAAFAIEMSTSEDADEDRLNELAVSLEDLFSNPAVASIYGSALFMPDVRIVNSYGMRCLEFLFDLTKRRSALYTTRNAWHPAQVILQLFDNDRF